MKLAASEFDVSSLSIETSLFSKICQFTISLLLSCTLLATGDKTWTR